VRNLLVIGLYGSLLLAACSGSPSDQARKLRQTEESWKATAELTAELRQGGAVPDVYARQTLEATKEELEKTRKKRQELSQ
jgi:hypothetical protein